MRPSHSSITLDPNREDKLASYDLSKHVAPKYNILGHLISSTKQLNGRTLDMTCEQKIPKGWARPGTVRAGKTKRDVQAQRALERIPDPSFDVDGDG